MARVKLEMPISYEFTTHMPINITDINYGNHLGNDKVASMIHEARLRFLQHFGYSELDIDGVSIIMGDLAIEFKSEGFYGNEIKIEVTACNFGSKSFDIFYKMTNISSGKVLANAKTGIVCFDYNERKTALIPEAFRKIFT